MSSLFHSVTSAQLKASRLVLDTCAMGTTQIPSTYQPFAWNLGKEAGAVTE